MPLINEAYIIGSNSVGSEVQASVLYPEGATITYQWLRSSIYNGNYEDISGAIYETYIIGMSDNYIRCRVTVNGTAMYTNILVVSQNPGASDSVSSTQTISNIGCGLKYSQLISKVSGASNIVADLTRINQSIYIILNTALGEVPMIPTLGCRIHEMIYNLATDENIEEIRLEVETALTNQEPRINVVNVASEYDENHTVRIIVDYIVKNTNIRSQYIYNTEEGSNLA